MCTVASRNSIQRNILCIWAQTIFLSNVVERGEKSLCELDLYQQLASMIYRHLTTVYIPELLGLKIFKGQSLQCRGTASIWKQQTCMSHRGTLNWRMHIRRAGRSSVYEMLPDALISGTRFPFSNSWQGEGITEASQRRARWKEKDQL